MIEAFVDHGDLAVANQLHLRLMRDSFQVGMQDGRLGIASLVVTMTIGVGFGVERVCHFELLLRRELEVLEQKNGVLRRIGVSI